MCVRVSRSGRRRLMCTTCTCSTKRVTGVCTLVQEMQRESAKSSALWQQLQDLQSQLADRDSATERLNAELQALRKASDVRSEQLILFNYFP